ncbi:MAG: hypothetical protein IJN20_05190 [Oscillospiraceae bacterium]|nr:hypothetical protein [Oscillospiraceae bacterium]
MRKVLIVAIVVLSLVLAGLVGFIWYDTTHFSVEGESYAKYAKELDLSEKEISVEHYLAVRAQLPECDILWSVPFQNTRYSSDSRQLQIQSLTAEDIEVLATCFPELKVVEAYECHDYAQLEALVSRLPEVEVNYKVDLGGSTQLHWTTEDTSLTDPAAYSFDALLENLKHMPQLKRIGFLNATLTVEERTQLQEAYPDIEISFTAEILGKEYDAGTTKIDLSALTPDQVEEVAGRLGVLTALEEVELMDASGTSRLSLEDVKKLVDAAPDVAFHYTFDFYGFTINTTDEEVVVKNIKVEDDNMEKNLRMALDVMSGCKRFVLESRGQYDKMWKKINSETLGQIREDYRDKLSFVWRVYFGANGSSLTDAEVLRAVYGLYDDNSADMKYLEKVRYMDIGHNDLLDYADFISGMTSLEAVIISGAPIHSLEPFAACKNLKFLEMVECHYIPDLEPLRECTQLEMLNISHTEIADISALEDLNLTHLNTINNDVPEEQIEAFKESHPDCWTITEGNHYGVGWRYDTDGLSLLPWYAKLDAEYHYISQRNIPNNIGWYLD